MLTNKKPKNLQEKGKTKPTDNLNKKPKKIKLNSPNKKTTPDKKKCKKDENNNTNKLNLITTKHQSQLFKSKIKQIQNYNENNQSKKHQYDDKKKLLTTSPIAFGQKSKSKSRSVSRVNTNRSHQIEKDKNYHLKSVVKKLYTIKKNNKDKSNSKSKSKSKSRSRLKTDRDRTPLNEIKHTRQFNVNDREVKLNKTQIHQFKNNCKKKIQDNKKSKAQVFLYPVQKIKQVADQPKIKLKRRILEIKTQFSQRRGSYFDQNLLKKLEVNHQQGKKAQPCPFTHIKSNFDEKHPQNQEIFSKSEMKTFSDTNTDYHSKMRMVQNFKKEQEFKWKLMLNQLNNLKNEKQVTVKIDNLINSLNKNYTSLQEKVSSLSKDSKVAQRQQQKQSNRSIKDSSKQFSEQNNHLNSMEEQEYFNNYIPNQIQTGNNHLQTQQLFYHNEKLAIEKQNQVQIGLQNLINRSNESILSANRLEWQKSHFDEVNNGKQQTEPKLEQQNNQSKNDPQQLTFKRSNNICLDDFYDFVEKKRDFGLKDQFQSLIRIKEITDQFFSPQMIVQEDDSNKISDHNLLRQLNLFQVQKSSIPAHNQKQESNKHEFFRQMQNAHKHKQEISFNFHNEVKIEEEMSSESMLLNVTDGSNKKMEHVIKQIENTLLLEFCTNILRSKQILHNFLTKISENQYNFNDNLEIRYTQPNKIESSKQYAKSIFQRLVNHIEINYKQQFMRQIQLSIECKPIDILRFIRSTDEQIYQEKESSSSSTNQLQICYINNQKIQEFETEVLKNQYFLPHYLSFNHCIYNCFSDLIDGLRPYGVRGKQIFSLQLSHKITDFNKAKQLLFDRFDEIVEKKYFEQIVEQQNFANEDCKFEIIYSTWSQIMDQIFQSEAITIFQTFNQKTR